MELFDKQISDVTGVMMNKATTAVPPRTPYVFATP